MFLYNQTGDFSLVYVTRYIYVPASNFLAKILNVIQFGYYLEASKDVIIY